MSSMLGITLKLAFGAAAIGTAVSTATLLSDPSASQPVKAFVSEPRIFVTEGAAIQGKGCGSTFLRKTLGYDHCRSAKGRIKGGALFVRSD